MNFARSAEMFPPPVYSPTGPFVSIPTTTQPEDIELAQTGATAPETPKQRRPRKKPSLRIKSWASILLICCATILFIYVAGCVITRLLNYRQRDPERLFKAECEDVGGRVVV
jgi:hypothetical protein